MLRTLAAAAAAFALSCSLAGAPASAAQLTGHPIADVQSLFGGSSVLTKIYDNLHKAGVAVLADMTEAETVASQKLPDGSEADGPSAQCLAALIPVATVVVQNTVQTNPDGTAQTADGPITAFVKTRIVLNALNSNNVAQACSWLQMTKNATLVQGSTNVVAALLGVGSL